MLTELPKELPESLHHAALVLDKATMAVFIERIDANTPDTAIGLHRLVNDFISGESEICLEISYDH